MAKPAKTRAEKLDHLLLSKIRGILDFLGIKNYDDTNFEVFSKRLIEAESLLLGQPAKMPRRSESLVISHFAPKTAALAFDRVHGLPGFGIPEEISFYCATREEHILLFFVILSARLNELGIDRRELLRSLRQGTPEELTGRTVANAEKFVKAIRRSSGVSPTYLFDEDSAFAFAFPQGSREVLTAVLTEVALVDEAQLTWEQVIEVRRDKEARAKYRRLIRWMDEELKVRSPNEVLDILAVRLDDYEWTLKKHGLKTSLGALSSVLDPKFLGATAAVVGASAVAAGNLWAALGGAALVAGRASISLGTKFIEAQDARRRDNYELAYIHEIKRQVSKASNK